MSQRTDQIAEVERARMHRVVARPWLRLLNRPSQFAMGLTVLTASFVLANLLRLDLC